MTKLYTVDRRRRLEAGTTLGLGHFENTGVTSSSMDFREHIDRLFPDGLTDHGESFLLRGRPLEVNALIDLLVEYVRRSEYPDRPSRYQSVFASPSLSAAKAFRKEFGHQDDPIWEVSAADHFDADMRHLSLSGSALEISYRAHLYWSGRPSDDPLWESLAVPPVQVLWLADEHSG